MRGSRQASGSSFSEASSDRPESRRGSTWNGERDGESYIIPGSTWFYFVTKQRRYLHTTILPIPHSTLLTDRARHDRVLPVLNGPIRSEPCLAFQCTGLLAGPTFLAPIPRRRALHNVECHVEQRRGAVEPVLVDIQLKVVCAFVRAWSYSVVKVAGWCPASRRVTAIP